MKCINGRTFDKLERALGREHTFANGTMSSCVLSSARFTMSSSRNEYGNSVAVGASLVEKP